VAGRLPEMLSEVSRELISQTEGQDRPDEKLLEELLARFIDLRRANAMSNNNQLRFLQEEDQQQGGANIKTYQEQSLQLTRLINSLDKAKRKLTSKRLS
jgi:hypothetical protein